METKIQKEFYNAKDVQKITGLCLSASYKQIERLNQLFIEEYPDARIIDRHIPIWFWNKKFMPGGKTNEKN